MRVPPPHEDTHTPGVRIALAALVNHICACGFGLRGSSCRSSTSSCIDSGSYTMGVNSYCSFEDAVTRGVMRYPPDQKAKARASLLEAGLTSMKVAGFNGIGVDGLAAAAGVTSGAF